MKGFVSNLRFAKDVEQDDWFRMCGFLCRVVGVKKLNGDKVEIQFYSVAEHPGRWTCVPESIVNTIVVRGTFPLKIYNQE